jgi:hypothetical protein
MDGRGSEISLQALTYLVTVLIHRLHESDPAWWQEFRDEIKQTRAVAPAGSVKDKVLERALVIVEESIKGHADE